MGWLYTNDLGRVMREDEMDWAEIWGALGLRETLRGGFLESSMGIGAEGVGGSFVPGKRRRV